MTTTPTPTSLPPVGNVSSTFRIAAQCPTTGRWLTVESVVTVPIGAQHDVIAEAMETTARVQVRQDALLQHILDVAMDGPPAATDAPAHVPAAKPAAPSTPPPAPTIPPAEVEIHVGRFTGWKLGGCTDTALTTISKGAWPTFGQDARDEPLKRAALQLLNDRAQAAAREKHPTPAAAPAGGSAAPAPPRPAAPSPASQRPGGRQLERPTSGTGRRI